MAFRIRSATVAVSLVCALGLASVANAIDRFVPQEYDTIQDAIDVCGNGDTVIVDNGVYQGVRNVEISFDGKAITVRSALGPELCIIDCQGAQRGFVFFNNETSASVVEGFTIINGNANFLVGDGGGIVVIDASPTINNMIIKDCGGINGGAMAFTGSSSLVNNVVVINCTATQRGAGIYAFGCNGLTIQNGTISGCTSTGNGAGAALVNCDASILNCEFINNVTQGFGGAVAIESNTVLEFTNSTVNGNGADVGGGCYFGPGCTVNMDGCSFDGDVCNRFGGAWTADNATVNCYDTDISDCHAGQGGGGCAGSSGARVTMKDTTVEGCTAPNGAGVFSFGCPSFEMTDCILKDNTAAGHGGAFYCSQTVAVVTNCLFYNNICAGLGGACLNDSSSVQYVNCTVVNNRANGGAGGAFFNTTSTCNISNSIVWANSPNQITSSGGATTVNYCDVQGGWVGGAGNINVNPQFVNMAGGDFHLLPGSPCIDSGDTTRVPAGVTTDLDGNHRLVDIPGVPNTGNGAPPVDMGCYEVQLPPVTVRPDSFNLFRGILTGGGLSELLASDDSWMTVRPGITLNQSERQVQLIVVGTSPTESPNELLFRLEAHASINNIGQWIELWNYDTSSWEQVDYMVATTVDSIVDLSITIDPGRFIQAGTKQMKAKISYKEAGIVLTFPWLISFDQTVWVIAP